MLKLRYIVVLALALIMSFSATAMAATFMSADQSNFSALEKGDLTVKNKFYAMEDNGKWTYFLKGEIEEFTGGAVLNNSGLLTYVVFDKNLTYLYWDALGKWTTQDIADPVTVMIPVIDLEKTNPDKIKAQMLGEEVFKGQPCVKKEFTVSLSTGTTMKSTVWFAKNLKNMPLKVVNTYSGGIISKQVLEFSNWNFEPKDVTNKTFALPADAPQ